MTLCAAHSKRPENGNDVRNGTRVRNVWMMWCAYMFGAELKWVWGCQQYSLAHHINTNIPRLEYANIIQVQLKWTLRLVFHIRKSARHRAHFPWLIDRLRLLETFNIDILLYIVLDFNAVMGLVLEYTLFSLLAYTVEIVYSRAKLKQLMMANGN